MKILVLLLLMIQIAFAQTPVDVSTDITIINTKTYSVPQTIKIEDMRIKMSQLKSLINIKQAEYDALLAQLQAVANAGSQEAQDLINELR